MVNISTKAKLLMSLREKAGEPVSGVILASAIGVSRVAVWKGIQSLIEAGYPIVTFDSGYALDLLNEGDFLYPWEFGEREAMFRHFADTTSTMDNAREYAAQGLPGGTVITAERQSEGRGRNGMAWVSTQGGLFCTILERPADALADYCLSALVYQIAAGRALGSLCGKPARLRWPNDIYIDKRKIAGLMTEIAGEGDIINWLAVGIGVNVNNDVPSDKATNCAAIAGHTFFRREVLLKILDEAEQVKKQCRSKMAYAQGNRLLAAEWNAMADSIGAKAAVVRVGDKGAGAAAAGRVLARGIFGGIDPAGRCMIKTGSGTLYFNPGPVSLVFLPE